MVRYVMKTITMGSNAVEKKHTLPLVFNAACLIIKHEREGNFNQLSICRTSSLIPPHSRMFLQLCFCLQSFALWFYGSTEVCLAVALKVCLQEKQIAEFMRGSRKKTKTRKAKQLVDAAHVLHLHD